MLIDILNVIQLITEILHLSQRKNTFSANSYTSSIFKELLCTLMMWDDGENDIRSRDVGYCIFLTNF